MNLYEKRAAAAFAIFLVEKEPKLTGHRLGKLSVQDFAHLLRRFGCWFEEVKRENGSNQPLGRVFDFTKFLKGRVRPYETH